MTSPLDQQLAEVVVALRALDPDGERIGGVLRTTFDQLYDGGRTGRYQWDQLYKTEKTHFGTLMEINLQRQFQFADGRRLDYRIAGHEVDAKYSNSRAWMLPPEAVGELCLLVTASDATSRFSCGVVRASREHLNLGSNRDAKKTLNNEGRAAISWLHLRVPLPPNVLLQLPPGDVEAIFSKASGQQRVNELFRRSVGRRVSRTTVETVAQQRDPMKRVRVNGGARQYLASEGIAIFGGDYQWQRQAAKQLGLPVPREGEFVSTYVALGGPIDVDQVAVVSGMRWRVAARDEADPVPLSIYGAALT